jgi:hypothetical protein
MHALHDAGMRRQALLIVSSSSVGRPVGSSKLRSGL